MSDSVTPWAATRQASLSFPTSQSLLKLMSIDSVVLKNHLILCHPLLLLPSTFPSSRIFSSESALCIRWPKYWSFSFSVSPSNEYSGRISFSIDWLDLLAVQGTLKSLPQNHTSKVSGLLYGPDLTSIHDYWKNHSLDYTDLCQQSEINITQLCLLLCDPLNCSPLGSSVHEILQARILPGYLPLSKYPLDICQGIAIPFSRGFSDPGIKPGSPVLQVGSLPSEPPGKLVLL